MLLGPMTISLQLSTIRLYGHISRSTGLVKMILQGTIGEIREDRQKKRWEDILTEWTGLKSDEAL